MRGSSRTIGVIAILGALAFAGYGLWQRMTEPGLPPGIASGNGRLEAVEIDVAAKTAGRIRDILVGEGDLVTAGQPLAVIDTRQLAASKRQAEAELKRAGIAVETAEALVRQREAENRAAAASLEQAKATYDAAQKQFARSERLANSSTVSEQSLDADRAAALGAKAGVGAAEATLAASEAGIAAAQAAVIDAQAAVEAAQAAIDTIAVEIEESTLTAPRDGRVQYLVAHEGEVVAAGGRVINLVDLTDVYMSFFLPTAAAGRIGIGTEARIVLDAAPNLTIPAAISYVADVAQFTPKTVETEVEREKLMFRVKAQIAPELLRAYIDYVKTGLPGVAYVRTEPDAVWPAALTANLLK